MIKHEVNARGDRSQCGSPGHSDTILTCSCGWEKRISHQHTTSSETQDAILYHRITSIEKELGIEFKISYGKKDG